MPMIKGFGKKSFGKNTKAAMKPGKPKKPALSFGGVAGKVAKKKGAPAVKVKGLPFGASKKK